VAADGTVECDRKHQPSVRGRLVFFQRPGGSYGFDRSYEEDGVGNGRFQRVGAETPLGRHGRLEDVAGVVLFYCCDLSAFVTSTSLTVNGGLMVYP
jgi:NAD(P)-dependent dehydrogenase (short-subunit alcohol dehydrogenase family)